MRCEDAPVLPISRFPNQMVELFGGITHPVAEQRGHGGTRCHEGLEFRSLKNESQVTVICQKCYAAVPWKSRTLRAGDICR